MKNLTYLLLIFLSILFQSQSFAQIQINSTGNIGMGSYSPVSAFTVRGPSSYYHNSYSSYSYVYESLGIGVGSNNMGHEATLFISPNSTVNAVLYVSDRNNRSNGPSLYVNGDAIATQGWSTYSDRKTKKRERRIERRKILSKLTKIRGKVYEHKSKQELLSMHYAGDAHFEVDTIYKTQEFVDKSGKTINMPTSEIEEIVVDVPNFREGDTYGVMAQDVLEVYPELVSMNEANGLYAVNYQGFIPLLIEGFNLQQEEMTEMRKQLKRLRKVVKDMGTKGK